MSCNKINTGDLVALAPYTELRDTFGNSFVCEEEATAVVTNVFSNNVFQEVELFCHGEIFYLPDVSLIGQNLMRI